MSAPAAAMRGCHRLCRTVITQRIIHSVFMPQRCIEPARRPLRGTFRAPSSKSATHRALVAAALADGRSTIRSPLDADDTRATGDGLRALGLGVSASEGAWSVTGAGGVI